jgi:hypothetical protein
LAERKGFDAGPEPQAWPYLLALPGAAPQPSGLHLQLNWIREGTLVHGLSHSLKGWAFSVEHWCMGFHIVLRAGLLEGVKSGGCWAQRKAVGVGIPLKAPDTQQHSFTPGALSPTQERGE